MSLEHRDPKKQAEYLARKQAAAEKKAEEKRQKQLEKLDAELTPLQRYVLNNVDAIVADIQYDLKKGGSFNVAMENAAEMRGEKKED